MVGEIWVGLRNVRWWGYGVAVFVICVRLRCVLATWFKPRWPARPRPGPGRYTVRVFDFMSHPVAFVTLEATGWPESPPAAIEIVKERGGSRQNTLRRVQRAFSEGWIFFVRHQSSTGVS